MAGDRLQASAALRASSKRCSTNSSPSSTTSCAIARRHLRSRRGYAGHRSWCTGASSCTQKSSSSSIALTSWRWRRWPCDILIDRAKARGSAKRGGPAAHHLDRT
jgi:hypothetical protein